MRSDRYRDANLAFPANDVCTEHVMRGSDYATPLDSTGPSVVQHRPSPPSSALPPINSTRDVRTRTGSVLLSQPTPSPHPHYPTAHPLPPTSLVLLILPPAPRRNPLTSTTPAPARDEPPIAPPSRSPLASQWDSRPWRERWCRRGRLVSGFRRRDGVVGAVLCCRLR